VPRHHRPVDVPTDAVDVLVLGGGPAGTWAAIAAAAAGSTVVLADKGFCGTSGSAAAAGNNLWYLPPGTGRHEAILARESAGGYLTDRNWMARILERTWTAVGELADRGYPFPRAETGEQYRGSLQGPQYLRLMRRAVLRAGVTVLDQSPAQHLLVDEDGVVAGATGIRRQQGNAPWRVTAGAVVLATGGCAFLSGALGLNVDTGDGALMAAELGAELSGMEFSCQYGIAPVFGAQTKGLMYQFATFTDEDGNELAGQVGGNAELQRAALRGPIYARLDRAGPEIRERMRWSQPNFFLPLDKLGIDPFTQRFGVRFVLEGTVRGTGGLRIVDDGCATTVPGLYAAGDVASRELVTGAISGGGSHNGSWAISSGGWAGAAAARFAIGRLPQRPAVVLPSTATTAFRKAGPRPDDVVTMVQDRVLPLRHNRFRTEAGLTESLAVLDALWVEITAGFCGEPGEGRWPQRAREAAALTAHARWMYRSALHRTESRGLQIRDDRRQTDSRQTHRVRSGGLDTVWTAIEPVAREVRAS
jgi:succinate dehydrogenase/fumarate reductase flavoprotein subunit